MIKIFIYLLIIFLIICCFGSQVQAQTNSKESPKSLLINSLIKLKTLTTKWLEETGEPFNPDPVYPYWNFFPKQLGLLFENQKPTIWTSPCFHENVGTVEKSVDGTQLIVTIKSLTSTINNLHEEDDECFDSYSLASASFHQNIIISSASLRNHSGAIVTNEVVFDITNDITTAEFWDLANKGLRVFLYHTKPSIIYSNVLVTIDLFKEEIEGGYYEREREMNKDMLEKYTHQNIFDPIEPGTCVLPPAEEVHSGDFFALIGFDGMGSMMSFAMGSTTSHTTVALWIDGELNICESTGDGVQCNPYEFFLNRSDTCQMIHAPLSAASREKFNATAAYEWFKTVDGLAYGFHTLLWTWIDTETQNFPCTAPDFAATDKSSCMTAEWSEVLYSMPA